MTASVKVSRYSTRFGARVVRVVAFSHVRPLAETTHGAKLLEDHEASPTFSRSKDRILISLSLAKVGRFPMTVHIFNVFRLHHVVIAPLATALGT